jgi:transposase
MHFVPITGIEQQDLQSLPRARERGVKARIALGNEIRGVFGEYGVVLPRRVAKCRQPFVPTREAEQAKCTTLSQELCAQRYDEFCPLEKRLAYSNEKREALGEAHPVCQRLRTVPGIGPLTATALAAAVSEASHLKTGRQFAAWLGLVPGQHSTGGKARFLGISKRGDSDVRKLLIHGARATLRWAGLELRESQGCGAAVVPRLLRSVHPSSAFTGLPSPTAFILTRRGFPGIRKMKFP